ncbi:MAG: GEVED domain-containing protein [Candidatus Zixiibacteriota bacterium]
MNRCRMTLRILFTLFAAIALLTSVAEAKQASVKATKTVTGAIPGHPNLDLKQHQGNESGEVGYSESAIRYSDETSKVAPERLGGQPLKNSPLSSFLAEDFETAVPPSGWSEIITNAGFNWKYQTLTSFSGVACADVEYDPALVPQDEWLVTPAMNFAAATTDLKVEFYWMMSYYWGVSPFDNYDLELWISLDGGATWSAQLWDESGEGVFSNYVFAKETVDLSGYMGQTNVALGWHYVGVDGAQAAIDLVSVNDDAAPVGRCCYSGTCADITEAACNTLLGDWDGLLTCATSCPVPTPGDNCSDPYVVTLPAQLPYVDANQHTCGRVNDYSATCLDFYDGGEDMVYFVKVTSAVTVDITLDPKGTTYTGFAIDLPAACPLDAGVSDCVAKSTNSSGTVHKILGLALAPGDYYLMVDTWPAPDCIPDFDLSIDVAAPTPAGANCSDPLVITLGAGDLPYTASGLANCGLGNTYSNTCMGSYDGGEDHITQLVLTDPVVLDITLNPNGTTWSAMAIDNVCPLDVATGSCIGFIGTSSGSSKSLLGLNLAAGTYYIMVDTWPTPNCIPNFSLTFAGAAPPPPNDNCASATPIGDVTNLPFDNSAATHDGAGLCSTAGKNLWYCFTAPITGNARISLCGSSYDTKLAVYDGCTCGPLGAELACEDDNCGLQSEAIVAVIAGNQYAVEVSGYSATSYGSGFLTIETTVPPPNDECTAVTPVVLTTGVPVTFTGDNTNAAPDCASFPGSNAWEAFTITECSDVTLDYCGTSPAFGNAWLNLAVGCPCTDFTDIASFDVSTCSDGNVTMTWSSLPAGTYYYPVLTEAGSVGPYTIHVVSSSVTGYCAADGFCDEYISRVRLGEIDNSSSCGSSYDDYTSLTANLVQTVPYTITVNNGLAYTGDQCGVWVDWNQDMCFDASEQVIMSGGAAVFTGTVTPPLASLVGPTLMRVRIAYTGALPACGTTEYGEVEDYTINVVPYAPNATITPNPQYLYYKFAVTPITNEFHFGMFDGGYTAADVNLSTVTINGIPASTTSVVASYPGFGGAVVKATLPLITFLNPYGLLYDVNNLTFTVAWDYNDATSESITDDVTIIGKSSPVPGSFIIPGGDIVLVPGDFDVDGIVSVSDAVGIVNYIFVGGTAPENLVIGDADCSQLITVSDAVYMIHYIFAGGAAPCSVGL